jgi:molybdate transport system substrate-binding protein
MNAIASTRAGLGESLMGVVIAAALSAALGCGSTETETTLIAAASSLRAVMPDLAGRFQRESGTQAPLVTYGGSGTLRRQVEAGAPIDLVIFAGSAPVDELIAVGLVERGSRRIVARNRLVLIGPSDADDLELASLVHLGEGEQIAIGDPETVPAGFYARGALETLGIWESLESRLVPAASVAAVLAYVERGEVAAGLVYATDASLGRSVRVLDRSSIDGAPDPLVVAALTRAGQRDPAAGAFLDFLSGPEGEATFARHGFLLP